VAQASARLLAQSAISRAASEADQLADRQAQDRLRAAQARLDGIAGAGHASRLALSQEEARRLEERVAALTLRAPLDGVAYGLPRKTGETVAAGQLVASVADPLHLRVRARVDQPDLPRIQVGQRFLVSFDGLPDRRWEGRVLSVSAGVRESGGREVGEVIGEIADPNAKLPPNASVNAQIVVGERHAVLTIPRAAMLRDGDRRYVYRLEGGRARRREIVIGLVGLNDVEVTSGLAENDRVIVPGMSPVIEGMRVSEDRSAQK
jgi:membrane fusion protein (multidrug efflux system)